MATKTRRRTPKAGEGKSLLDLKALRRAVTAATPPDTAPDAPTWGDPSTVVLCFVTDASVVQSGFDPQADPPPFVVIGGVAELDVTSVTSAITATLALDDVEDEGEDTEDGANEVFVLCWGDPTKPENLHVIPEDSGEEDGGDETEAPPVDATPAVPAPPAMALATEDGTPVPGPDAVPDEGRVEPVPGPLGMWEACLVTEGVATDEVFQVGDGDEVRGRFIPDGLATWRTPPIPVGFAMDDMGNPADRGHENAPVGGSAVEVTREGNRIMARGPYLDNVAGAALKAAVDGGAPIGPSVSFVGDVWDISVDAGGKATQTLLEGSIAGFCVLPYEAQHSGPDGEWLTWFRSTPDAPLTPPEAMPDQLPAVVPIAASGVVACGAGTFGAPLYPPKRMLEHLPPESADEYAGLVVVDDGPDKGHVYGAVAGGTCHIAFPGTCLRVSDQNMAKDFAVFHKGLPSAGRGIKTAEGDFVSVGQITMAGGHADIQASATEARTYYDNTGSVIANGTIVWAEALGVPWFSGCLVPSATEEQVQTLRACGEVSVDYRQLEDGRLHLVHLLAIPRGGFPPMRALSAAGDIRTLILASDGQFGPTGGSVTDAAWDGSASRFNDEQYQRAAAACEPADKGSVKQRCMLPHHEPDGTINRNGVHAAAQRVSSLSGRNPDAVSAAKAHLRSHYTADLKEEPPDSLGKPAQSVSADAKALLAELGRAHYARRLSEESALLASAHERERDALAGNLR